MKRLRFMMIVLKGRRRLLKIVRTRQLYERLLKNAKENDPFMYSYMTPKDFEKIVNLAQSYFFASQLSKTL